MKAMTYKGFTAAIEFDGEDEIFTGRITGIRDVIGFHADTVPDLKAAFREAVEDYMQTCAKVGKEPQKPYSGNLMLRVAPELHAKLALAAELTSKSINKWSEEVLADAAEKAVAA